MLSLFTVSCGGGGGGGSTAPISDSNLTLLIPNPNGDDKPKPIGDDDPDTGVPKPNRTGMTLARFSALTDSGGVNQYKNLTTTTESNGLRPGTHHAIEIDLTDPYPSEIIWGDTLTYNPAVFAREDTQTQNDDLIDFSRGHYNVIYNSDIHRVHSYDLNATAGTNIGISAQFIALEPSPSDSSWSSVSEYGVHVSGANFGAFPTGAFEYEGLTVATKRVNGIWFGEQPFLMILDFNKNTGTIDVKSNSVGTFLTPDRMIYNKGEVILQGNLAVNMTDGTITGTNLNFQAVETINGTPTIHFDSSRTSDESVSLYGTLHGDGVGVSGVFHDNAESPTIIGSIIGRKGNEITPKPLRTGTTLNSFMATFDSGGVNQYKNTTTTTESNGLKPGIHHAIEYNLNDPYPSEIIWGDSFTYDTTAFTSEDTQTQNGDLVGFRRGHYTTVYNSYPYRVHSYDVKKTDGTSLGVLAQFVGLDLIPSASNWTTVKNYGVQVSGANLGTLPTGKFIYEGLTVATSRVNGTWFGEQPFQMVVSFATNSGTVNIKPNSVGTFLTPGRTKFNAGEVILQGNLAVNMIDGTFTGTNLSFKAEETENGATKTHFDSTRTSDGAVSIYGSFHGSAGEGVSGVFHDNADSPKIVGAIVGEKGRNLPVFNSTSRTSGTLKSFASTNDDRGVEIFVHSTTNDNPGRFHTIKGIGINGIGTVTSYPLVEIFGDVDTSVADELRSTNSLGVLPNGDVGNTTATNFGIRTLPEDFTYIRNFYEINVQRGSDDTPIYADFVGSLGAGIPDEVVPPVNWIVSAGGPNLVSLPTGTHDYVGHTLIWARSKRVHWLTGIPNSRFEMSANFENGYGTIASTHLTGDLSINLQDGTFTHGDTMNLKENANSTMKPAELYGTFHGSDAFGVSGVFHEVGDSPDIFGAIIGSKKPSQ